MIDATHPTTVTSVRTKYKDGLECICGNMACFAGFVPCDDEGRQVDLDTADWNTVLLRCANADCDLVFDQARFTNGAMPVIGRAVDVPPVAFD